jgi:hypothetical protein
VNAHYDEEELQELLTEQQGLLTQRAEKLLHDDAKNSYYASSSSSFADVMKLEKSSQQHGFILRTTRGEDERQLRQNNPPHVTILSILKNGTHFTTTSVLEKRIAERFMTIIDREYEEEKQENIVVVKEEALETAIIIMTYLPPPPLIIIESVAVLLVSELDGCIATSLLFYCC